MVGSIVGPSSFSSINSSERQVSGVDPTDLGMSVHCSTPCTMTLTHGVEIKLHSRI